jgi:glucokinase
VRNDHVGVDIGGTGVRATTDDFGLTTPVVRLPLDRTIRRDDLVALVAEAVTGAIGRQPDSICVTVPAFVDARGKVTDCPSIPALTGVRLAAVLSAATRVARVVVLPDLAAAAVGEHARGVGRDVDRFLCVAIGTGVNAAAVHGGRLVDTAFGCLGDAGHVIVEPAGPECPCGGHGCLEAVTSGFALARDGAPFGWADAQAVFAAARAGEQAAVDMVDRAGAALGRALASWSAMLWPDVVAVAGGLSAAGEQLLQPAREEMLRVGTPYIVGRLRVVAATLGADAALWGAVLTR